MTRQSDDDVQSDDDAQGDDTIDHLVGELRDLRVRAGVLPYAEIARRIGRHRARVTGDGVIDTPARSTIYDAFRLGRSRLNAELVGEIARALGEDEESVRQWMFRCHRVQSLSELTGGRSRVGSEPQVGAELQVGAEPRVDSDEWVETTPEAGRPNRWRPILLGAVLVACVLVDLIGHTAVGTLHLALYLDMIGTAIAAIMGGPWFGVAVALLGNSAGMLIHGEMALPFALVNAAGALVWGYGVRRSSRTATFAHFFRLSVVVAVVCTLVAVPILMVGYHGGTGHESDQLTHTFTAAGQNLWSAVFLSNGITSILDKLVTGFVALAVIQLCTRRFRAVDPTFSTPVDNVFRFEHGLPGRELLWRWLRSPTCWAVSAGAP